MVENGRDIGSDKETCLPDPDHQRTVFSGADKDAGRIGRQDRDRVRPFDPTQSCLDGGQKISVISLFDQVRDYFSIGLGGELVAGDGERDAKLVEVLDYAVMDDRDLPGTVEVRVGVLFRRRAMRCPPGMSDANRTRHPFVVDCHL